jgi:hypothetical protein
MPRLARALVIASLLTLVGCRPEASDVRSELCGDLGNLRATVEGLAAPPDDARVGSVRGDLEKLDPTFGNVSSSGMVPEETLQPMLQAHVAYRNGIGHLGDDEPFLAVPAQVRVEAAHLYAGYQAVVRSLGCAG